MICNYVLINTRPSIRPKWLKMASKDPRNTKMSKTFEKWPPSKRHWTQMVLRANAFKRSTKKILEKKTTPGFRNMGQISQFTAQSQHYPDLKQQKNWATVQFDYKHETCILLPEQVLAWKQSPPLTMLGPYRGAPGGQGPPFWPPTDPLTAPKRAPSVYACLSSASSIPQAPRLPH